MAANYLGRFPVEQSASPFVGDGPVEWAMAFITAYGQIDGSHHKTWVLDQVSRILNGTPVLVFERKWGPSEEYPDGLIEFDFETGEPSEQYLVWVQDMLGTNDDDGEREYDYDEGIAP